MQRRLILRDSTPITLTIPHRDLEHLQKHRFRGKHIAKSGNFSAWENISQLLHDEVFYDSLSDRIEHVLNSEHPWGKHRITITYPEFIGWENTEAVEQYLSSPQEFYNILEDYSPSHRWLGLRVKPTRTDILVPKTCLLTLMFRITEDEGGFKVFIHSLYPGFDVGNLVGDVTARERRVFFDWDHPGEPVAQIK